jgi:hypothetical protein
MDSVGLSVNYTIKGLRESSQNFIVITAWVKEDERGGQGHTFKSAT